MSYKGTPLPWEIGSFDPSGGYDCLFAGIQVGPVRLDGSDYGQESLEEITPTQKKRMELDARLIAEAPNLLAMLEHAVHWHDQRTKDDIARYQAVISKAKGE